MTVINKFNDRNYNSHHVVAGECDKMNAEKTLVGSCDLPSPGCVMQAVVLKALLVSLGRALV